MLTHTHIFSYQHKYGLNTQTHIILCAYSPTKSQMHINILNIKFDYHSLIYICMFKHTTKLMSLLKQQN